MRYFQAAGENDYKNAYHRPVTEMQQGDDSVLEYTSTYIPVGWLQARSGESAEVRRAAARCAGRAAGFVPGAGGSGGAVQ